MTLGLDSIFKEKRGFPGGSDGKDYAAMQETQVQSLSREDLLENGVATHSNILTWRIPWTEEPGGLQSLGDAQSQLNCVTNTFTFEETKLRISRTQMRVSS